MASTTEAALFTTADNLDLDLDDGSRFDCGLVVSVVGALVTVTNDPSGGGGNASKGKRLIRRLVAAITGASYGVTPAVASDLWGYSAEVPRTIITEDTNQLLIEAVCDSPGGAHLEIAWDVLVSDPYQGP